MHKNYHIEIPDSNKFIKELKSKSFIEIDADYIYESGFNAKPFIEFEKPKNFPNCCNYHSSVKKNLEEWFNDFPDCCDYHKKIKSKSWFDKQNYENLTEKILLHLSYTENFITQTIENDNWYKEITDYISYMIDSFGFPTIGGNQYYSCLESWINETETTDFDFPKWKRNQLIEFLESFVKNSNKTSNELKKPTTDLNLLYSIFQRWLKSFPSLPFFKSHKELLKNKIPLQILFYEPDYNRFTQETKYKCRTKSELIEFLVHSTKESLKAIRTPELIEKKLISSRDKYKMDLINEEHNLRQNKLLTEYSKEEIKYIKVIKKWLKNEKLYINTIKPLLDSGSTIKLDKKQSLQNKKGVFISYSWDNELHKDKVIAFNNYLRKNGFYSDMDRSKSQDETALDFRKMMHRIVTDYSKVIIVLSHGYKEKANDFKGGVGTEYEMIIKDFDKCPRKYILVSFCEISDDITPIFFREKEILNLKNTENYNNLFSKLKDENIIDFSEVSENKPKIKKKKIEDFKGLMKSRGK